MVRLEQEQRPALSRLSHSSAGGHTSLCLVLKTKNSLLAAPKEHLVVPDTMTWLSLRAKRVRSLTPPTALAGSRKLNRGEQQSAVSNVSAAGKGKPSPGAVSEM